MSRLKAHLTTEEQCEVCNSFQKRLMVTDAMGAAKELLERKGNSFHVRRGNTVAFLEETCPHLWQAYKLKQSKRHFRKSIIKAMANVTSAITGKKPNPTYPYPPFPIFGDEPVSHKRKLTTMRGDIDTMEPDTNYHNKQFDQRAWDELVEEPLRVKKRREEENKKAQ